MSTLTLTPPSGLPGSKVKVAGKGFPARVQVLVSFGPSIVLSVNSDSHGAIQGAFTVPNVAKAGTIIVRSAVASSGAAKFQVEPVKPVPGDSFAYH